MSSTKAKSKTAPIADTISEREISEGVLRHLQQSLGIEVEGSHRSRLLGSIKPGRS